MEKRQRAVYYSFSARLLQDQISGHERVSARKWLQVCVTVLSAHGCVWTVFTWHRHGREE